MEIYVLLILVVLLGVWLSVEKPKMKLKWKEKSTAPIREYRIKKQRQNVLRTSVDSVEALEDGKEYLVHFKEYESMFGNDPLEAVVRSYKEKLDIQWENGWSCVIDFNKVYIYEKD